MKTQQFLRPKGIVGLRLPFTEDFTALADGALPLYWTGPTWEVSGGAAINTPTEGAEMLTDPGLEAAYTSGLCDSLIKVGSPTVSESADAHAGSKAQSFAAVAFNNRLNFPVFATVIGQWYSASVWAKSAAGTGAAKIWIYQATGVISLYTGHPFQEAAYTLYKGMFCGISTNNVTFYPIVEKDAATFDTHIIDDCSLKPLVFGTMLSWLPRAQADVVIKVRSLPGYDAVAGAIARADKTSGTTGYLAVYYFKNTATTVRCTLVQILPGGGTQLLDANASYAAGADLELRLSGNTAQVFYNNSQVGTDQAVDASLANNPYVAMFGNGGVAVTRFFCCGELIDWPVVHEGTSITAASNTYAWRIQTDAHIVSEHQQYKMSATNVSLGSANSWYGLHRQADILAANPMLVTLDGSNDTGAAGAHSYRSMEALIRLIWTANPQTRLVGLMFPKFSDVTPNSLVESPINAAYMTEIIALYAYYGIPYLDYLTALQALITGGHDLDEYYASGDAVHPLEPGHNLAFSLIEPYLPAGGATAPSPLPARLYDNGDLEETPIYRVGTDNDGTTGTWATSGTQISSSTVGSTVTFVVTCTTWTLWRDDTVYNLVDVSVDGGAWEELTQFCKVGTDIPAGRAEHTIVCRVRSGTVKIDQFWAI